MHAQSAVRLGPLARRNEEIVVDVDLADVDGPAGPFESALNRGLVLGGVPSNPAPCQRAAQAVLRRLAEQPLDLV